jgi:hypothetical protein
MYISKNIFQAKFLNTLSDKNKIENERVRVTGNRFENEIISMIEKENARMLSEFSRLGIRLCRYVNIHISMNINIIIHICIFIPIHTSLFMYDICKYAFFMYE